MAAYRRLLQRAIQHDARGARFRQFSLVSPGIVRTEFGVKALHGGPDSRELPGSQSAEEVAEVIASVVTTRVPDVYTRAGAQAMVATHYATIGVDP